MLAFTSIFITISAIFWLKQARPRCPLTLASSLDDLDKALNQGSCIWTALANLEKHSDQLITTKILSKIFSGEWNQNYLDHCQRALQHLDREIEARIALFTSLAMRITTTLSIFAFLRWGWELSDYAAPSQNGMLPLLFQATGAGAWAALCLGLAQRYLAAPLSFSWHCSTRGFAEQVFDQGASRFDIEKTHDATMRRIADWSDQRGVIEFLSLGPAAAFLFYTPLIDAL